MVRDGTPRIIAAKDLDVENQGQDGESCILTGGGQALASTKDISSSEHLCCRPDMTGNPHLKKRAGLRPGVPIRDAYDL